MSVPYYGDFAEDDTVNLPWNSFSSNDPAASVTVTDLVAADIFVHKDGSATSITTDGATIDIDAPGVGAHMITIDTSAHADYSTGSEYAVRIDGVTIDSGTVNAWIGAFSIERAGGALAIAKLIEAATITNATGTDVAADIIALKAETVLILADTDDIGVAGAGLTDLGGMSTGMKNEVNAEVDTAITTTTYGEPAKGLPGATISMEAKISFLYKAWRNRSTQTSTVYSLYNDDASTVDHDATVSDDATTADRGEMTDGP